MALISKRERHIWDLPKQRLFGYAESFQELAKSYGGEFVTKGEDRQGVLEDRRLWENRQVLCSNFIEVAQIMKNVAQEVFYYQPMEDKKRRMLMHALRAEGIYAENFCYVPGVGGRQSVGISMFTRKKGGIAAEDVADMLSVLLQRRLKLSVTSHCRVDGETRSYIFVEEAQFMTLTGFSKAVKESESISGDNYSLLESERGRLTVLLSDGTGSGEKACRDSSMVLDLMEKMLEAGYGKETAVNLVNSALFARGEDDSHPTLDACDLDLYEGCCDFYKLGGAASFLKRDREVETIASASLPLGIFQSVELQTLHRQLHSGDYLVMMTDGVLDALRDNDYEETMAELIGALKEQNPRELAERLLHAVLCVNGGHIQDDMTIVVTGVWKI